MQDDFRQRLVNMPDAKRIAVAIYGESVAAYRYGVLADKAVTKEHHKQFTEMQEEEQGHQAALENLASRNFPGADFVLTAEDKELVIVGTRMLEVGNERDFHRAMQFLHDTENRTGEFYDTLNELMPHGKLGAVFREMAAECREHAQSLLRIQPP